MHVLRYIIVFCIIFLLITPVSSEKNKGLFSGSILNVQMESFVGNIPDIPSYIDEKESSVNTNPQDIDSWIDIGKVQFSNKNYNEAKIAFERAIQINASNNDAWDGYLLTLFSNQEIDALLEKSEEAISNNPNSPVGYYYKAGALSFMGDPDDYRPSYERALVVVEQALTVDPTYVPAWILKAGFYSDIEEPDEAIKAINQAIKLDPKNTRALYLKGLEYLFNNQSKEAIDTFDQLISVDPTYYKAFTSKALIFKEEGRFTEVIQELDKALWVVPENDTEEIATIWNNKGDAYYSLGDNDKAMGAYEQAIGNDSKDARGWSSKGDVLLKLGRNEEAIDAYKEATVVGPNSHYGTYAQEQLDILAKDNNQLSPDAKPTAPQTQQAFQTSAHKVTEDDYLKNSEELFSAKDYEGVVQILDEAVKQFPENEVFWDNKAAALNNLGRYDEAIESIDHALDLDSSWAHPWYVKGFALEMQGKLSESLLYYETATNIDSTLQEAQESVMRVKDSMKQG